ncbi:sirohydrochlorin cobaltochelatase [Niameybacter massiliensis]|uniref:Sirohydrochlorin cobaltochelatase n=1 Tax=Holtiella tumoricola TaxID=3018743 RepID=A0AA42DN78_9FIRM|nr:sirohydrochlorin cobaltochelatase [Holtiella tumoricola]MDA3731895.1 sirohydrochlorin cobaltochelatase [Holtiella tumoricola]
MKKAILVVSFGTSYLEQKKESIDPCIHAIEEAFSDWDVYESFSSSFLRKRLLKEHNLKMLSPEESMETLQQEGYEKVIIQPLFLIEGIEYDKLLELQQAYEGETGIHQVAVGKALLSTQQDYTKVVKELEDLYSGLDSDLLLLGHGTTHQAHASYAQLREMLDKTTLNCIVTTLEDRSHLEMLPFKNEKVTVVPFMLVAGMHILRDVMGDHEESFKYGLEQMGKQVEVVKKGLGSYTSTRAVYIGHIQNVIDTWENK